MSNYSSAPKQDAYETELAASIDNSQVTITVASAPGFTLSGSEVAYGVINPKNGSRETVKITGISGVTLTVVRGIAAYEGGGSTASAHSGGATFIISDNWQNWDDAKTAINTKLDQDGGNTTTVFDMQIGGSNMRMRLDGSDMKLTDDNQSEVTLSTLAAGGGADEKTKVSSNDATAAYLDTKLVAGDNVTLTENNDAGNETLTIAASSANEGVTTHTVYTPAYLTGGSSAEGTFNNWLAVLDGSFRITIDGSAVNVDAIDFTGVTSMADVATYIQTALNTATGGTETVAWSTDHFVITSTDATVSSEVSVTTTSTGTVGTDISGAGASDWLDCDTGNGTATAAVLDRTADAGKVALFDLNGDIDSDLMDADLREAATFFGSTDISGAEAETLTDGSDASTLHYHQQLLATDTDISITNTTTETDILSLSLAANTLGTGNVIKFKILVDNLVNGSGINRTFTVNAKYGATTVAAISATWDDTNAMKGWIEFTLIADGTTGTQRGVVQTMIQEDYDGIAPITSTKQYWAETAAGTAAEDSTGALTLAVTGTWSVAAPQLQFNSEIAYAEILRS